MEHERKLLRLPATIDVKPEAIRATSMSLIITCQLLPDTSSSTKITRFQRIMRCTPTNEGARKRGIKDYSTCIGKVKFERCSLTKQGNTFEQQLFNGIKYLVFGF
jgi:hypothetical protein